MAINKKRGLNVFSAFNGMGCGWLALDRCGIKVNKRFSSEIDKYANKVNDINYPDTIQLGDITKVTAASFGDQKIDLIMGGSPCQGFSFAGKGLNFNDPRSKLFFEFVRILNELREINPDILFLLENVRMKAEHEMVISKYLGCNPIKINSALVSAQNRVRLYWTNINAKSVGLFGGIAADIPQPADRHIFLKDILQQDVDEKYFISSKAMERILSKTYSQPQINPEKTGTLNTKNNSGQLSADSGTTLIPVLNDRGKIREQTEGKSNNMDANYWKGMDNHAQRTMIAAQRGRNPENPSSRIAGEKTEQRLEPRNDGKTNCLTSVQKDNLVIMNKRQQRNFKEGNQKAGALLSTSWKGSQANRTTLVENISRIRRLTEIECERLQCVPDGFTDHVSSTQRYKMLGNGWTIDVIAYIFSFIQ